MKINTISTKDITVKFDSVVKSTKEVINNANNFALANTEEAVLGTINTASQWQDITTKALEGGFKLMENQQTIVFDTLESFKKQFVSGKNKFSKIFA